MTRNQIFTTLEFVNDTIRMVLGEYYNDKFYVYDVFESKCLGLVNNEVVDQKLVADTIKQIRDLINEKHDILIEEVILALPSDKLIISTFTSSSPVTGRNSLISQQDINEAYRVAKKVRHADNLAIVSVVPIEYYLDTGEKMEFAPIRYKSNTFKTLFNVLLLPISVFELYLNMVSSCNLKVREYFLDSECLYTGIFDEGDINCAVVDLNRFTSNITIFKRGKLLNHYSLNRGSDLVEKMIMSKYQVKESDLNRVIYTLANGDKETSSQRAIYKNEDYGAYKYLYQYQVDEIISDFYKEIFEDLSKMCDCSFDKNIYDVYLSGKASSIRGLDKLFSKVSNCNASVISPTHVCLNNPGCLQTVGLIRLNYRKLLENKTVIENGTVLAETRESRFEKFILDEDELN